MEHQSEKLTRPFSPRTARHFRRAGRSQNGVALVIALGFLVLITIIVLAFFQSVTTEYTTAKTYSDGASSRFLADTATNLVIGQIAKATKPQVSSSGPRLTWASQPGMIRTYDDTGANGDCYKLYSSAQMVIGGANVLPALAADIPSGWNTLPANYTDLNAPVTDYTGKLNFPVIDGNVKTLSVNGASVLTYDDNGDGVPDIEGFSIPTASVPTYSSGNAISATNNPVPMPVQWLYVLRDGSIVAPDPSTSGAASTTATFTNSANPPTVANPIVGRVAFWTDDETCKLNVNTASEGSYFAFPHTSTATDMQSPGKTGFGYAVSPPAAGEYNRYPGHPATTCLSVALGSWLNPSGYTVPTAYSSTSNDSSFVGGPLLQFLSLTPRTCIGPLSAPGGSQAGTVSTASAVPLSVNSNRLFASVDELVFNPDRTVFNSALENNPSNNNRPLDRLKFFLTASSRAPEVTPFNTPKVSMWPQWSTAALRQVSGNTSSVPTLKPSAALLAFCSSFGTGSSSPSGKYEYFFQRLNGSSYNSCTQDWLLVPRNQQIANYLYNLGKTPIPGFGGTFVSKYTGSYPSIVVECLDYIRSSIGRSAYTTTDFTTGGPAAFIAPLVVSSGLPGASAAAPLKGFGHYPIITQIVLSAGLNNAKSPVPFLGFQFFMPTMSNPGTNAGENITIQNTAGLGITPLPGQQPLPSSVSDYSTSPSWGFAYSTLFSWLNTDNPPMKAATWVFNGYSFNNTGATMTVGSATPVTFLLQDNDNPKNTIQQISVTFPPVTMLTPTQPTINGAYGDDLDNNTGPSTGFNIILLNAYNTLQGSSARAMECGPATALKGDWRLLGSFWNATSTSSGATNYFSKSANYTDPLAQQAHSLRVFAGGANDTGGWSNYYATSPIAIGGSATHPNMTSLAGSLSAVLKNTDYEDFDAPCAPVGMTSAVNYLGFPGDWDTGPGLMPDGPYVNPTEQNNNVGINQYYNQDAGSNAITGTFSPNRLVASPVRFGSLPTGSNPASPQPWQTLLFCPNPAARSVASTNAGISASDRTALAKEHLGFATPPDHLFLEFFTMPTVQPYAISEPLSSAGKVNLNYQLAPFTNIERSTALRGVFKNTLLSGICGNDIASTAAHPTSINNGSSSANRRYKFESSSSTPEMYPHETHFDINRDATISGIEEHFFNTGNIFRYASEICSVFLVPTPLSGATYAGQAPPTTYDAMAAWWTGQTTNKATMALTGDNLREEPYDHIYPRVTTKSNSYTIHYRVQTLRKKTVSGQAKAQTNAAVWQEGQDIVTGEYRGSSLIERYIDPNDPQLNASWDSDTMALNLAGTADLSRLYKFRVVSTKKFAP